MQIKLSETQYGVGSDYENFKDLSNRMIDNIAEKAHELQVTINWSSAVWTTEENSVSYGPIVNPGIEYHHGYTLRVVAE